MGPRALIGIDQEGGAVVRATFLPHAPAAMALGAAGTAVLAEEVGAAVARGVKSLGFNWNFAPVLDVNNNPENPVIAERSFSSNPSEVVRLAGAWMRGALGEGVACCIKHFPGHGDTRVDSHLELPVVDKSRQALRALELKPFRALQSEAPAVMTAHIVYRRIDPDHPATLSRKLLRGMLREAWGYHGVIITDSLVMKAIHQRYGHDRAAVLALQAGADMVMALGTQDEQAAAVQAIAGALADGSLARAELRRSRARLDALAQRYPVRPARYAKARREADERLMERAWALSLTRVGDARPPPPDQPLRVVTQRSVPAGVSEAGPSGEASQRFSKPSARSRSYRSTTCKTSTGTGCRRMAARRCWHPTSERATAKRRTAGGRSCTSHCGILSRCWTFRRRRSSAGASPTARWQPCGPGSKAAPPRPAARRCRWFPLPPSNPELRSEFVLGFVLGFATRPRREKVLMARVRRASSTRGRTRKINQRLSRSP